MKTRHRWSGPAGHTALNDLFEIFPDLPFPPMPRWSVTQRVWNVETQINQVRLNMQLAANRRAMLQARRWVGLSRSPLRGLR